MCGTVSCHSTRLALQEAQTLTCPPRVTLAAQLMQQPIGMNQILDTGITSPDSRHGGRRYQGQSSQGPILQEMLALRAAHHGQVRRKPDFRQDAPFFS